jgi:DNA-binding transcriptional ArsR family regulator
MEKYENEIKLLKALTHPARLAILEALREGEACVCHMEALFGWRQAYISQQLSVLREAGLIEDRRDGWNIFYHATKPEIYTLLDSVRAMNGKDPQTRNPWIPSKPCSCPRCQEAAQAPAR